MTAEERLKLQFISKFLNKYSYVYTHVCIKKKNIMLLFLKSKTFNYGLIFF